MDKALYLKKLEQRAIVVFDKCSVSRGWSWRWNYYKKNGQPAFRREINGNNVKFICLGDKEIEKRCFVEFKNIRPLEPRNIVYETAELLNEKINDVRLEEIRNPMSSGVITKSYLRSVATEIRTAEKHLAGIEASIEQTIGYESPGGSVKGETKIGTTLKYEFERQMESGRTTTIESTTQIEVPAGESVSVSIRNSSGKYRQKVQMDCDFDHSITFYHRDDDINTKGTWPSVEAMRNTFRGVGSIFHPKRPHGVGAYSKEQAEKTFPPLGVHYVSVLEFDKSSKGTTIVQEIK